MVYESAGMSSRGLAVKQAYLNDAKGLLFEYLVAVELAKLQKNASLVTDHLSILQKEVLQKNDNYLRVHDLELYQKLPKLAHEFCGILSQHPRIKNNKWHRIILTQDFDRDDASLQEVGEADLLLYGVPKEVMDSSEHDTNSLVLPLSLKFCRWQSSVNTKSGGVLSFFTTYFNCKEMQDFQNKTNEKINKLFEQFSLRMNDYFGHGAQVDFKTWQEQDQISLPGELPETEKRFLYDYYYQVICQIYEGMNFLLQESALNKILFRGLQQLCGHSSADVLLAIAFHDVNFNDGHKNAKLKGYKIESSTDHLDQEFKLLPPTVGTSSFLIQFKNKTLSIRVKPMRSFTSKGLKINCALKYHDAVVLK